MTDIADFDYKKWEGRLSKLMSQLPEEYMLFEAKRIDDERFSGFAIRFTLSSAGLLKEKPEFQKKMKAMAERQKKAKTMVKPGRRPVKK